MDIEELIGIGIVGYLGYWVYTQYAATPVSTVAATTTGTGTTSVATTPVTNVGVSPARAIAYVNSIYQTFLGRSPDPAGAAGWTSQLIDGTMTEAQVYQAILASPEFASDIAAKG